MANLKYVSCYSGHKWRDFQKALQPLLRLSLWVVCVLITYQVYVFSTISVAAITALILFMKVKSVKQKKIHKSARAIGFEGEHYVIDVLDGLLSDDFYIANNIRVPNAKSKTGNTEIDILVISHNRLWCIEVKNYTGRVFALELYKRWIVRRQCRWYFMRDPCRQGYSQKLALQSYLLRRGIKANVGVLVIFPSNDVQISGSGYKHIPICRTPGEVAHYIRKYSTKTRYNQQQIISQLHAILKD